MPRFKDLLGTTPDPPEAYLSPFEIVHSCRGRKIMDGYYSDASIPDPTSYVCSPSCIVFCDRGTLHRATLSPVGSPRPSQFDSDDGNPGPDEYWMEEDWPMEVEEIATAITAPVSLPVTAHTLPPPNDTAVKGSKASLG